MSCPFSNFSQAKILEICNSNGTVWSKRNSILKAWNLRVLSEQGINAWKKERIFQGTIITWSRTSPTAGAFGISTCKI